MPTYSCRLLVLHTRIYEKWYSILLLAVQNAECPKYLGSRALGLDNLKFESRRFEREGKVPTICSRADLGVPGGDSPQIFLSDSIFLSLGTKAQSRDIPGRRSQQYFSRAEIRQMPCTQPREGPFVGGCSGSPDGGGASLACSPTPAQRFHHDGDSRKGRFT